MPLRQPTLRERQYDQTRNLILDTLCDQLAESGAFEYSQFELARRANVSVRTIYRYFPDRDALMKAMGARVQERLDVGALPVTLDEMAPFARLLFRQFDTHPELVIAQLTTSAGLQIRTPERRDRIARARKAVAAAGPDLDEATRTGHTAILSSLLSASTWRRMYEEFGMDGAAAGDAVANAISVIVAAIFEQNAAAKRSKGRVR